MYMWDIYVCGEREKSSAFTEYDLRLKNKDEESILSSCVGSWQETLIVSVFEACAYIHFTIRVPST